MLKVHVWLSHGNMVGHASLSFGANYVSFWPKDAAGKKDLKIKKSHPGHFMNALYEDIKEEKLSRFIADLISNTPKYQLAKYNCSNVVAECLKVACDKDPSFHPTAHDYSRLGKILGRGIWTPNEILRYAREIA